MAFAFATLYLVTIHRALRCKFFVVSIVFPTTFKRYLHRLILGALSPARGELLRHRTFHVHSNISGYGKHDGDPRWRWRSRHVPHLLPENLTKSAAPAKPTFCWVPKLCPDLFSLESNARY